MSKRHQDAIGIQQGACNPIAIANAIVAAGREVWDERGTPTTDPAIRLMVHQLAFICKADDAYIAAEYSSLIAACEEKKAA